MNRGFAFYFKNAMKSSAATIWKNRNMLQVLMYFLAELVARVTIIFSPIFDLANIRQAKIVQEKRRMDIPETLQVATKGKPLWTMVLSIIAEAFIFLGGTLLIAVLTGILFLIGFIVCSVVHGPQYIIWLFCIPGGLVFLVYALIMVLIFSPTPYIIETNPNLGVYETVKICFDTMKGRGKVTAFLNFFIPTLIEGIILATCASGFYYILFFVPVAYAIFVLAAWVIFSVVFILLTIPMFDLAKKVAQKSLFEDIALDPANARKRTAGINIKVCNGVKFRKSEIRGNLVALFDETQTDSIPAPDSPARKKIKEKAEKAALNKENLKNELKEAKPEGKEPVTARETVSEPVEHVPSVSEVLAQSAEPVAEQPVAVSEPDEPAEPAKPENKSEEFDYREFISAQSEPIAQSDYEELINDAPVEPAPQPEPQPVEQAEAPAEAKPKTTRTRTAKPKAEGAAEEKPKTTRTRTTKPKADTAEAGSSEAPAAEKPKRTRTTTKKTSD